MSVTLEILLDRITLLEDAVNSIYTALNNVASTEAIRQLNLIRQQEIDSLQTDVDALEAQIELLRNEVFK